MHIKLTDFMLRVDELTDELSIDPRLIAICITNGNYFVINRYRNLIQYEINNNQTHDIANLYINLAGKCDSWNHVATAGFSLCDLSIINIFDYPMIVINELSDSLLVPIFIFSDYYGKLLSLGSPNYPINDPITNFNVRHMLDTFEWSKADEDALLSPF